MAWYILWQASNMRVRGRFFFKYSDNDMSHRIFLSPAAGSSSFSLFHGNCVMLYDIFVFYRMVWSQISQAKKKKLGEIEDSICNRATVPSHFILVQYLGNLNRFHAMILYIQPLKFQRSAWQAPFRPPFKVGSDRSSQPLPPINQHWHKIYSVRHRLLSEFVLKLCTTDSARKNPRFEKCTTVILFIWVPLWISQHNSECVVLVAPVDHE